MPTEDKNLAITKLSLDGGHVAALNKLSDGLGFTLVRIFAALGNTQEAQSGHKGSVGVAKQTKKDNRGLLKPGLKLNDGRIAEVGDPEDDQDAVNLRTLRSALNCEQLAKLLEECADDLDVLEPVNNPNPDVDPGTGDPGTDGTGSCSPIDFTEPKIVDTGMTQCHTVRAFNEYVYVCGFDDPNPKLQVYRLQANGKPVLLSFQVLSQECRRFVLQGHHIFGCNDGADSQMVLSLDVGNPWDPAELDSLDVGFPAAGLYADANWLYVVGGEDDIAVIDFTDATALRKVN